MALGFGSFSSSLRSPQRWLGCARTTLKGVVGSLSVLGILTTMVVQPVLARSPAQEQQPSPEDSTQQLLSLHGRYQHAAPAQRAQALDELFAGAVDRSQHLASLVKTDPAAVLRVAIPDAIRSSLPSEIQPYIEKTVQLEGKLEVILEHTHPGSILRYFLDTGKKRFSLHFAADPPFNLQSGAQVRVNGVQVENALALSSGSTSVQALSLSLPNTFGAQKTLLILVNFQDNTTQPYTSATAQNVVFSTTNNFDLENSYGQTWLTGDVVGWYTLPMSYTVCDYTTLATSAKQAATAAGVNLSNYTRYVYAFPDNACTWWGLGTVGGNPSQAWINGSLAMKVVSHEMGHNLGLYHSNAWECGSTTLGSSCSSIEYGDTVDTMGNPSSGHFNAFQKERLGWLNYGSSPPITTVQSGGVYTLDPYETATMNPKALKILKATDATTGLKTWYYVEFRRPVGIDSFVSSNSNVLNGVLIHTGSESSANSSYLLDMTPATSSWSDPALDVGQNFTDPDAGVTITPMSVGSTGATISVSFGPVTCVPANPSVTLSPSATQWVQPGTPVTYTVTVTDNDNSGCSTTNFALQAAAPSGWTAALGAATLSLNPGGSASTTLTVTSPASAALGFYNVSVTAANSANATYTATTSGSISLAAALGVTVKTDKTTYSRGQTVSSSMTVSSSGAPVAGASVTFTITKANGSPVTSTATTGTTGAATFSYRLRKQDPIGSYKAQGNATFNGIAGSASTNFMVQ